MATISHDPLRDQITGYPKLAAQMAIRPETAMFRRFSALSALDLLYFQAELVMLEKDLQCQQLTDSMGSDTRKHQYALTWFRLRESQMDGDTRQLELVKKSRETLRLYHEALIRHSQIQAYPDPDPWDISYIQSFLHTKDMGPLALRGLDATVWGSLKDPESWNPDLVALRPRTTEDPFSSWAARKAIAILLQCGCARFKKPMRIHGVVGYEDATVLKITSWMTSILASLMPVASISILYSVHSMSARLAIIGTFNLLISVCLRGFTNAKRSEVFAVTAAFAAVQVVFVGVGTDSR